LVLRVTATVIEQPPGGMTSAWVPIAILVDGDDEGGSAVPLLELTEPEAAPVSAHRPLDAEAVAPLEDDDEPDEPDELDELDELVLLDEPLLLELLLEVAPPELELLELVLLPELLLLPLLEVLLLPEEPVEPAILAPLLLDTPLGPALSALPPPQPAPIRPSIVIMSRREIVLDCKIMSHGAKAVTSA
jgi:hypothetical protein